MRFLSDVIITNGLAVDTNTLYVDPVNNRVGIGTSSPSTTLDVNGVITATGGNSTIWNSKAGIFGTPNPQEVAFFQSSSDVTSSPALIWNGANLVIVGGLQATTKSFNIEHPTKPGRRLIYGVLEGPEHGVYTRGRSNEKTIELPEEWTGLVDESSITVQITPIGKTHCVYVVDIKNNKVVVSSRAKNIDYFYYIQAMRKDIDKLQIEQ